MEGTAVSTVSIVAPGRAYRQERAAARAIAASVGARIAHTHGYRADVVDANALRGPRVHTVTTVHGFAGGGWRNRLYEGLQRRAFRGFDAVVAVSERQRQELMDRHVPATRLHLIPNGYQATTALLSRDQARAALGLPPGAFVIGWVGRLGQEKGLDVLLSSLALVRDRPITLAVIGTGRERASLEAMAAASGIASAIRWMGLVPDAARFFPAFDLFVLSSRTEGTPIALFEAMDAGIPIVATAVGGVPAVVRTSEALLVPSEDPAGLAEALRMAYDDPAPGRARSVAARRRLVEVYGVEPWLDRYEQVYAGLVDASGTGDGGASTNRGRSSV
jgi:glycosyltransferase involved in cell wall biosynthesis